MLLQLSPFAPPVQGTVISYHKDYLRCFLLFFIHPDIVPKKTPPVKKRPGHTNNEKFLRGTESVGQWVSGNDKEVKKIEGFETLFIC
jgi:hypothetical protein